MKLPRNVDGRALANHLIRKWQFTRVRQAGSHIQLRSADPVFTVTIPEHKPVKIGTLQNILRVIELERGISASELLRDL